MTEFKQQKLVIVGHVDHGKSTLLGRILMDFGMIPQEKLERIAKTCQSRSISLEPAFFLDALQEEQEQGISIDTTRINFEFDSKRFLLIDVPGHFEFLKNMISGAADAETGILVVDAQEGICSQTLRHLKVLGLLGVANVVVVVTKMDKVEYSQSRFEEVAAEIRAHVEKEQKCLSVIPVSALKGENLSQPVKALDWYKGLPLLPQLAALTEGQDRSESADGSDEPFRMIVQDVYRFTDERFIAGRIVSGRISAGAQIFFSPSGKESKIAVIQTFPDGPISCASKGDSVALRLQDQIFVERGEIISRPEDSPEVDSELEAKLVWLNSEALDWSQEYLLKIGTAEVVCRLVPIDDGGATVGIGDFVDVAIKTRVPISFDRGNKGGVNKLVACTKYETVACGMVKTSQSHAGIKIVKSKNLGVESGFVSRQEYEQRQGHKGTVLWTTGLSGAGKSTLAKALERRLFVEGCKVIVLDGDNLRSGVCADLGFEPEDRSENIRRVAHMAKLFLNTGAVVITACISPYEKDRRMAEEIIGKEDFNELFIFCPVEICQQRDPKGLYKRASGGQIKDLSGLNAPYQPPAKPKLRLDTSKLCIEAEVEAVMELLHSTGAMPASAKQSFAAGIKCESATYKASQ